MLRLPRRRVAGRLRLVLQETDENRSARSRARSRGPLRLYVQGIHPSRPPGEAPARHRHDPGAAALPATRLPGTDLVRRIEQLRLAQLGPTDGLRDLRLGL